MPLIYLIVGLAAVGLVLWAINAYLPMEPGIKRLLNIVVIALVVLWVLKILGLWDALLSIRV
jgi:hypothetical protein